MILSTSHNVGFLPKPNTVERVLSDQESDRLLTATAFVVPVFPDGTVMMAMNTRRGMEIPGGHVDPWETLVEAAARECLEEVGCTIRDIRPLGYLRMVCGGDAPEGYRYPFPLSYQQFYYADVVDVLPYIENAECLSPTRVSEDALLGHPRASVRLFTQEAIRRVIT